MRYPKITHKQQRYAYNIMNTETTKQEAMLLAGYSESAAKKPSVVERSDGFQLAMAGIFNETGNTAMKVLKEFQARDISKETTKDLVNFFDVMTKAMERLTPKQVKQDDTAMRTIFATTLDDTPLKTKDETPETIDNTTIVLHNDDVE